MTFLYIYAGIVRSVYDGDTITVDIDLGFNVWLRAEKVRLARINSPEIRGVEKESGEKARDWLRQAIGGEKVVIKTHKDQKGKYGRWIADVIHNGSCINDVLVAKGLAKYQSY